jgi:hypothetical protein
MTDEITTVVSAFNGQMGVAARTSRPAQEILVNADLGARVSRMVYDHFTR